MYCTPYQHFLCSPTQPDTILEALSPLDHVVYLSNHGHPVIACCAERYTLVQANQVKNYQATTFNRYVETEDDLTLTFSSKSSGLAEHFNGGYMGFIAYDYAAQQLVKYKQRQQPAMFIGQFSTYLELSQ